MSEYSGVEKKIPSEAEIIESFLRWARERNVHLASQGRPPFGRQGTWFIPEFSVPEMVDDYLAWKAATERNKP
jgi:hypothetical protein